MTFKVDCLLGNALPEPSYTTATLEKRFLSFKKIPVKGDLIPN